MTSSIFIPSATTEALGKQTNMNTDYRE